MARRSGLDILAYMGVEASNPPTLVRKMINPNENITEFNIGTIWINNTTDSIFMLTNLEGGAATWTALEGSSLTVNADSGSATESGDELTFLGTNNISTTGAGSTITIDLDNGANGELLIGGGSGPVWGTLASSGGSVTITNTANGINLEAAGVAALTELDGDSGSALPAAGIITVAGGTNITTSGAVNTLTVSLDASPDIAGTLTLSASTEGVLVSNGSGVVSSSSATDGQVILGSTGSTPVFGDLASADGSVEFTGGAGTLDLSVTGRLAINAQTGTSYTLVLADEGKLITLDNASAITLTVPPNADVAFPTGSQILFQAKGVGTVSFSEGSGVTIVSRGSVFDSAGQWAMMSLIKTDTNVWVLSGDIT